MTSHDPILPLIDRRTAQPVSRAAFTLVELLAVIVIIGILAAIIIPVVGRVKESARKSQCASNLRQIHSVVMLCTNENHSVMPLTMDRTTNKNWWEKGSPLEAYAGGSLAFQRLSICPDNTTDPITTTDAYGKWVKNEYGYPYVANYLVMPDGMVGINKNQIATPTEVVLMTDAATGADWGPGLYLTPTNSSHLSRIGTQHGDKANTLWMDGHVSFSDKSDIQAHCAIR